MSEALIFTRLYSKLTGQLKQTFNNEYVDSFLFLAVISWLWWADLEKI